MARYALIDGYLETMRSRIRWRSDLDDLVAEMEDHLYSTVEGLCARGQDHVDAQRATLDRFGDPEVLRDAFASTDRGGIAMPTDFTRRAGNLARLAAGTWAAAVALLAVSTWLDQDEWLPLYLITAGLVTFAGTSGVIALAGLGRRVGGFGALGLVGLVITAVGVAMGLVVTWAVFFWMPLQGIGMLLVALAVRRSAEIPQLGLLAIGSGFLLGTITFTIANLMQIGFRDSYGDYPVAWFAGAAVGCIIVALGLLLLGSWLAGEEPADVDVTPIAA